MQLTLRPDVAYLRAVAAGAVGAVSTAPLLRVPKKKSLTIALAFLSRILSKTCRNCAYAARAADELHPANA